MRDSFVSTDDNWGRSCAAADDYSDCGAAEDNLDMTSRVHDIEITYSEVATIHGNDNYSIKVLFDAEAEGMEFFIRQDGESITMSRDEAEALVEALVRFLVDME